MGAVPSPRMTTKSEQRERIAELHGRGLTAREIATLLNVSTQRVYQQLRKLGVRANPRRDTAP